MSSLRFNPKPEWNLMPNVNRYFLGLTEMLFDIYYDLQNTKEPKMLEIGSYKGESTMMFPSHDRFVIYYLLLHFLYGDQYSGFL